MEAEVLSRRCVIMRLADFSYEEYQKALRQSAGAVVIILPKNMSAVPQDIVQVITSNNDTTACSVLHVTSALRCYGVFIRYCVIVTHDLYEWLQSIEGDLQIFEAEELKLSAIFFSTFMLDLRHKY